MKQNVNNSSKDYKIPIEGSLGLLAYGDKGLRAWRKVRDEKAKKQKKK
jgi:hypothetical protein